MVLDATIKARLESGGPARLSHVRLIQRREVPRDPHGPEPATLLLVGTGAAGLGLARWVMGRRTHGRDDPQ